MRTSVLYNSSITAGATVNSATFAPRQKFEEDLVIQISSTVPHTTSIQGRLLPTAPWVDIILNATGQVTTTALSSYFLIPAFPEIRTNTVVGATNGSMTVWVGD